MELPLWMSEAGEYARFHEWDVTRAVEAGLRFRPVEETVRDALTWASARDGRGAGTAAMGGTAGVGLDPEKERRLLHEWRATTAA
jgi:2'-hydroxyisoflavone reductase